MIGEYAFNYRPAKDGGWYGYYGTPTLNKRREFVLEPQDNFFLKGSNNKIQCYARFSHAHTLSFAGFSKSDYSQQFIDPNSDTYVPDLNFAMENSNNPNDKLSQDIPQFTTSVKINGKDVIPNQSVAFVKCRVG